MCHALSPRGVPAPVLFLTARNSLPDRLGGFHAGGDDYLTKPFALADLLVRVDALFAAGRLPARGSAGARARPRPARHPPRRRKEP